MKHDRFKKLPPSGIEPFLKEHGLEKNCTRIRSTAHLARIFYAKGLLTKADLAEVFTKAIAEHKQKIKRLRAGRASPRDSIAEREAEIRRCEDALDEVRGLPDDEKSNRKARR